MEIGVGTILYEFAGVPLKVSIQRIADFGIGYIDILAFGIFNPALFPVAEQRVIAKEMVECGVKASSIVTCANGNLASNDSEEVKSAMRQLKLATLLIKELGGRQVLVGKGVGNIDFNLPREQAVKNVVSTMKEYCDWCLKYDIIVTLELEPEALYVCNGIEAMKMLLEEIGAPNLAANIDIGHLNILRLGPNDLECIKEKIVHVHISDNNGLAHTNCVIGEGNANINWYIEKLIEFGIDENARRFNDIAVAGIEIGEPGEYIKDPDFRLLKSYGNVLLNVSAIRKRDLVLTRK